MRQILILNYNEDNLLNNFLFLNISYLYGNSNFYIEGVSHYEKQEFDKAKFKFEQDIVFNPKSEKSYLYLSKIFNKQNKKI